MIELDFLKDLIKALDESSLDSVEIERGGTRVRLAKTPDTIAVGSAAASTGPSIPASVAAPTPPPPAAAVSETAPTTESEPAESDRWVDVTSPMVGTFYRAPAPDAPPYIEVGSSVRVGDTLCIIEAMKLMNELPSEVKGKVVEICVEDAEPVEYGQVLFRIDPES